jgi:hypothetical protein
MRTVLEVNTRKGAINVLREDGAGIQAGIRHGLHLLPSHSELLRHPCTHAR